MDRDRFFIVGITTILPRISGLDYIVCAGETGAPDIFMDHYRQETIPILSSTAHPDFLNHFYEPWWYNNTNFRLSHRRGLPDIQNINSVSPTIAFHAIEVALLLSGRQVAVIGLDLCVENPDKHHAFNLIDIKDFPDDYPTEDEAMRKMRFSYERSRLLAGAWAENNPGKLVNCTEGGAVECFPKMTLMDWINA